MIGIILSAGKADSAISQIYNNIPTGLIPINGRPVISHIVKSFSEIGITEIYVSVGYEKEKLIKYAQNLTSDKIALTFIETDPLKGAGNSLCSILERVNAAEILISVADTIFDFKKLDFSKDFILAANDYYDSEKWCLVESKNGIVTKFIDKELRKESSEKLALVGVYYLKHFNENDLKNLSLNKNLQISDILEIYMKKNPIQVVMVDEWIDVGHIEKYYKAKQQLLSTRFFNSLEVNRLLGTITKRSDKNEKFINEINWQLNLPKNISILFPRIIDYSLENERAFVTMEYYGYPNISELWLYSSLSPSFLKHILENLFSILEIFYREKRDVSKQSYHANYVQKTEDRIRDLINLNSNWNELLNQEELIINDKKYCGWSVLRDHIYKKCESLYHPNDNCLIHGDFCLSNILYDMNNGVVRLIDPRGKWGGESYGDIKYDIAKLRHSICGDYDFIVNDLFEIKQNDYHFTYKVSSSSTLEETRRFFDRKVSEKFDLNKIILIEGLLFISMLPLHNDSLERQYLMFCKAIENFSLLADDGL